MSETKEANFISCPVCQGTENQPFISTNPMMHSEASKRFYFRKCQVCASVFLSNPVAESKLPKYYAEHYLPYQGAEAWGKYAHFVKRSQQKVDAKRLTVLQTAIKNTKTKFNILDVGCGKPSFLKLVQQKLKADCSGIDFTDQGWQNGCYNDLDLQKTSLVEFQPKKTFDAITLWHYLEHDFQLQDTVDKLYHCLKPGGKLIIEVPDYQSLSAKRQGQYWQGWHSPRHLSLFSPQSFELLFPQSTWTIKQHKRYGTLDAFTLWWLGRMEAKGLDWSASMEKEFWQLLALKVLSFPIFIFEKIIPMGIQLVVIEKKPGNE